MGREGVGEGADSYQYFLKHRSLYAAFNRVYMHLHISIYAVIEVFKTENKPWAK